MSAQPASDGSYHAFEDPLHDKLMAMLLALGGEVWVLHNRMELLEVALQRRGLEVKDLIDELAQDPGLVASENERRDAFLARFLRGLDER